MTDPAPAPSPAPARPHDATKAARRTQRERRETTRTRLLEAAIAVVAEVGYERASIAEIGKRAGYSRGIVTHTFGSKAGLLEALADHMYKGWSVESLSPAVDGATGLDAMVITLRVLLTRVQANPAETAAFYRLLFDAAGPMPELRPVMQTIHRQARKQLAQWIRSAGEQHGSPGEICPDAHAALFLSMIRGAVYQWLLDPEVFDIASAFAAHEQVLGVMFTRAEA